MHADYLQQLAVDAERLIALEPSIEQMYREEYQAYVPKFQLKLWSLAEFITEELFSPGSLLAEFVSRNHSKFNARQYLLFGHCSQSAADAQANLRWQKIFAKLNSSLSIASSGCCGMAGIFGHETAHLAESKAIFNLDWQAQLDKNRQKAVLASGFSCRHQIRRFTTVKVHHPISALYQLFKPHLPLV